MFPTQFANAYLTYQTFVTNLHLLGVELRCKLQEKLHRMTGSLVLKIATKLSFQSNIQFTGKNRVRDGKKSLSI